MTREVVLVAAGTAAVELIETMQRMRVSCIVVCEAGLPVGIVTERDLVGRAVGGSAAELMTAPVVTIPESMPADEALRVARARKIRHLPVVDARGRLSGIVTQTDLLDGYVTHVEDLVASRTQELVEANRKLEELSRQDDLTGIGNRRAMEEALGRTHDLAARYSRPYSLALFDVDYFKKYNDRYGHAAGDAALVAVTHAIVDTARSLDQVFRYGGEEILVLYPETLPEQAALAAERVVKAVRASALRHADSPSGHVTLSGGVAGVSGDAVTPRASASVVQRADAALYRAKELGRDRVVVAS